jgi:protoheme IX farnesyltransferase
MKTLLSLYKSYQSLTKSGIVLFVVVVGLCGYALGMPAGRGADFDAVLIFILGLYCLSAGSLALNQAQEVGLDEKMDRTKTRPIISGVFSKFQASVLSVALILVGLLFLLVLSWRSAAAGLLTVVLYNLVYTYFWKRKWAFGAVPGAIPGALPPVIGYLVHEGAGVNDPQLFYLFGILFLWQMPHFWILAIKLKKDYAKGGVPVLPLAVGDVQTRFHMGLYLFAYLGLAVAAPLYVSSGLISAGIIWAFALLVLLTFFRYLKNTDKWLLFFLTLNISILVFSLVPAVSVVRYYL